MWLKFGGILKVVKRKYEDLVMYGWKWCMADEH